MDRMLLIDTALRLLSAGQLMLIALVIGRGPAPRAIRWATVMLLLSVAAYLADVAPVLDARNMKIWPVIQLGSQSSPLALWVFAHLLFERRIDRRLFAIAIAVTLACWLNFLAAVYWTHRMPVTADVTQHALAFALTVHTIWIAITERGDDLIEPRRAFRTGFVVVVGIQTLAVVVVEAIVGYATIPWLMLLQSGSTLLAVLAFGAVLLSSNADLLFYATAPAAPQPSLSPAENVLKQQLDAAMAGHVYGEPGLTIGVLAGQLGVPEHRLRALINQRLGYRNFSDFLNSHRIADAKEWLRDPTKVALPVLTIAMDLGYGSLAPFNRAFRDITGQTPTDWRRAALGGFENS
ncbi:MAG TPA: helix-turn-helix domain-containing protein [Sphingomonas sp.]